MEIYAAVGIGLRDHGGRARQLGASGGLFNVRRATFAKCFSTTSNRSDAFPEIPSSSAVTRTISLPRIAPHAVVHVRAGVADPNLASTGFRRRVNVLVPSPPEAGI
ncbi:a91311a8-0048-4fcb-ae3c-1a710fa568b3 [Thermothielavioides terrestris]|uniref:A91311a8-0048-4fcb-ae3c-1a710fa568b3 n=1 Tax=Thermothielavioides terrestris TaxID=2587410 RepID=A0A446BUZ0_9PEZI|nr:a91311a8-0048-4fcb-ae3c-1a710fa568b3 [Thermothielavioides terrestris]